MNTGLLAKNKEMAHASGRFQVACYKEEIEASLRTPSFSGFELLDLHDYLGQGGALIRHARCLLGEQRATPVPTEFRQWNNTTVPLPPASKTASTLPLTPSTLGHRSSPLRRCPNRQCHLALEASSPPPAKFVA